MAIIETKEKYVLSKTLVEYSPEAIDKVSDAFRKNHFCIASTINVLFEAGRLVFVQTIFYKP
jgi:hypothetical protein